MDDLLRLVQARDSLLVPQSSLAGWSWERGFVEALVHCALALQCILGSSDITYAELAPDFESHSNRALPAGPGHHHARQVLVMRE